MIVKKTVGKLVMSRFIHHSEINNEKTSAKKYPLFYQGHKIGLMHEDIASALSDDLIKKDSGFSFPDKVKGFDDASEFVDLLFQKLVNQGVSKYHNEPFAVTNNFHDETLFKVDRSAMALFGFVSFGIHVNGYVVEDFETKVWLANRSKQFRVYPGMKDQIIAGGQPYGLSLYENLVKESYEEAGFKKDIIDKQARPVSYISYHHEHDFYVNRSYVFIYDLELLKDQIPINTDGEVESFELLSKQEALNLLESKERIFKPNCGLVMLDFALRHGFIDPDTEKDYVELIKGLRLSDDF